MCDKTASEMNLTFRLLIYESYISGKCPVCGIDKNSRQSFCPTCYFDLPIYLRNPLYRKFGDGYEPAFQKAMKFLKKDRCIDEMD